VQRSVHCAVVTTAPATSAQAARKAATRDAIADALLDLLGEGNLRPTAREIAQRAGISVRSVYVHFDDLDDLFCVAARRQLGRVAHMLDSGLLTGPTRARAMALVRRRVEIYGRFGAVARAAQLQAPFSETLARIVRDAQVRGRRELEHVFAPELDAMEPDDRERVLALLDVLTGGQAWTVFSDTYEVPRDDAIACIVDAVVAALGASNGAGR
jgi:AcrR family transcriptional regulator